MRLVSIVRMFIAVAVLTALAVTTHAPAVAEEQEEQVRLGIAPVDANGQYFNLTLEPGSTLNLSVELTNHGTSAIEAITYPADVHTIVNGGFGAADANSETSGPTLWINYDQEQLNLRPDETVIRDFTLSVPEDTEPGEYLTSLVIQNLKPVGTNDGQGIGFQQVIRRAIAVAVTVPGPPDAAIQVGAAQHDMIGATSTISFSISNPGNVHVTPYGEFTLIDVSGTVVDQMPVKMAIVYSKTDTVLNIPLKYLLDAGDYTATLTLREDKYGATADSGPVSISVPELVAPKPIQLPDTEQATQPAVIETQMAGIPTWALLIAIPLAILAGAVVVYLAMKRKMQPQVAQVQTNAAPMQRPPVVTVKRVPVRQIVPPSKGETDR